MNLDNLKESLSNNHPPAGKSVYITALWFDAKGDWDKAHNLVQDLSDRNASWIHAYLHRKEGDIWNADYWYAKAGKKRPATTLEEEWEGIVTALL